MESPKETIQNRQNVEGILAQMESYKASGQTFSFLGSLNRLEQLGVFKDQNIFQKVRALGEDKAIWKTAIDLLLNDDRLVDEARVHQDLRAVEILGIEERDDLPKIKETIAYLRTKYPKRGEAGITRRNFLRNVALLGLSAVAAAGGGYVLGRKHEAENREAQTTLFDEFIKPMREEVKRRRAERAKSDPEYYHRVDKELNEDRINILLFFTGTFLRHGHEPTIHGANQIISFNTKTKTIDLISITSDVRSPKVERYATGRGQSSERHSINSAFETVKELGASEAEAFKLMGETFEEATGLSIDFQGIGTTSGVVKDFIDQIFGSIDVDVPRDFPSYKVDIDGVEYPDYPFKRGRQEMDGVRVVQYISADDWIRDWKDNLHHHRKHIVFGAIKETLKRNLANPLIKANLGAKFISFLKSQLDRSRLKLDFEIGSSLNFGSLVNPTLINKPLGFDKIKDGQNVLIVSHVYGGEGVRMVAEDSNFNPKSRQDLESGVYTLRGTAPDLDWMQIPPNSNPDAPDLVTDYWGVPNGPRDVIKKSLLPKAG